MRLRFLGGAQEVGRSAVLLDDGKKMLFDYGVKLDHKTEYPIEVPEVDTVALSHAHLDHCGFVPALYNKAFPPTIGATPTLDLSLLLLEDSMAIAKKQHESERFHKRQLKSFRNRFVGLDYHSGIESNGFDIELFDAGHISGSAITLVTRRGQRIVYTGDFKLAEQRLHKGAEIVKSDVLVTESTYATRTHPDVHELVNKFIEKVKEVLDNGGTALIPVFAVGRSQEILTTLYEHGLASRTYLDGMAKSATSIVLKYPKFITQETLLSRAVSSCTLIEGRDDRYAALSEPSIILTTSGMLNGGPVLDYITKLNKASYIFLTGYQVEGTNGRMLLDAGRIVDNGDIRRIDTPVSYYDFSAHADKNDLYKYIKASSPQTVVCIHGDSESTTQLAENLKLDGFEAYAPKNGDTIEIK